MTCAWIVIPTYDEVENVGSLVAAIRAELTAGPSGVDWSILIVDDNSPDGTGRVADQLAETQPDVHVLHRPIKAGLADAYTAGFGLAVGSSSLVSLGQALHRRLAVERPVRALGVVAGQEGGESGVAFGTGGVWALVGPAG